MGRISATTGLEAPVSHLPHGSRIPRSGPALLGVALAAIALAGLAIATYLATENVQGQSGICTGVAHGCATVQQSRYGKVAGTPVSVPGAALYAGLALIALAWARDWLGWRPTWALLGGFAALCGFGFSMYLTGIEAFVLDAWCVYCVASALLMTALAFGWGVAVIAACRRAE
jgi:uncharacterized membrane protein